MHPTPDHDPVSAFRASVAALYDLSPASSEVRLLCDALDMLGRDIRRIMEISGDGDLKVEVRACRVVIHDITARQREKA